MDPSKENVYAPTEVNLVLDDQLPDFYVVASRKFLMLYFLTLGLYALYWFYENWRRYSKGTGENLWPVARAVFAIFFTHRLCEMVQARLRTRRLAFTWTPSAVATTYVIAAIISSVLDRLSWKGIGSPATDIASLLTLPITGWALWRIQSAINVACGDESGSSNARITGANTVWMLLGTGFWVLVLFGLTMPDG